MSDSPLFPWLMEGATPLTQEIKDPVSQAVLTLPRLNGLTVNEVMFAQWALDHYLFLSGELDNTPRTILELTQFCHRFLCLRLGLADWVGDALLFPDGKSLTPNDSLTIATPDGQRKAAPLHMLYLIYAFFVDEQKAWLSGKAEGAMMQTILAAIAPLTGQSSTGDSSESTQATLDLPAEPMDDAQPTSSRGRSKPRQKLDSAA